MSPTASAIVARKAAPASIRPADMEARLGGAVSSSGASGSPAFAPVGITRVGLASAEGIGIDEPALAPEPVHPSFQAESLRPEVAVVDFAEITRCLERLQGPIVVDAEHLAEISLQAEHAADLGIVGFLRKLLDVRLGNAEFLGRDERVAHPGHDVRPLPVALAGEQAERLLRDHLAENHPVG